MRRAHIDHAEDVVTLVAAIPELSALSELEVQTLWYEFSELLSLSPLGWLPLDDESVPGFREWLCIGADDAVGNFKYSNPQPAVQLHETIAKLAGVEVQHRWLPCQTCEAIERAFMFERRAVLRGFAIIAVGEAEKAAGKGLLTMADGTRYISDTGAREAFKLLMGKLASLALDPAETQTAAERGN